VPLLAGMLVGVLLGYWLEGRLLDFHARTHWWRRLLAALLGALAFIALQSALKWLGTQLAWPDLLWQSVRGLLLGGFVAALMPWLLVRLRLLPARLG
jgi:glycerophosphoryl diester phosphodiesterase